MRSNIEPVEDASSSTPKFASSWTATDLGALMGRVGVYEGVLDMCRFGMVSKDELGVGFCRKPTRLLTNI